LIAARIFESSLNPKSKIRNPKSFSLLRIPPNLHILLIDITLLQ